MREPKNQMLGAMVTPLMQLGVKGFILLGFVDAHFNPKSHNV